MNRYLWMGALVGSLMFTQISCTPPGAVTPPANPEAAEEKAETTEPLAAPAEPLAADQLPAAAGEGKTAAEPAKPVEVPEFLKKAMTLPEDKSANSLAAFLKSVNEPTEENMQSMQEAMTAIQTMPREQAMELMTGVQKAQGDAANLLLACADATSEQLKMAMRLKMDEILNGNEDPAPKLEALRADFEKRNLDEMVWTVEMYQPLLSFRQFYMDKKLDEFIDKVTANLDRAKGKKWISLDIVGIYMQLLMNLEGEVSNDKLMAFCASLKGAMEGCEEERMTMISKQLDGVVKRLNLAGSPMEFAAETLEGKAFDLDSLKGKVVLIDFWASWCAPCMEEMPNLQAAYEKYRDKGFEVVGFSLDEDMDALKKCIADRKISWPIVVKSKVEGAVDPTEAYAIAGIPTLFLIDKDGKVISTNVRGKLDEELEKLFPMTEEEKAAIPNVDLPAVETEEATTTEAIPAPVAEEAKPAEEAAPAAEK
ncbi:MAG: TlpA disulfide reductase family protein [Planctomycetia bacterium]|nr:TlpA disulfide reductase family protein [Planctomycetia bacterium]